MSCSREPSSPRSGAGADSRCDATIQRCPLPVCPQVEIEINNTANTNDNLVQLQCIPPAVATAHRYHVPCQIRALGGGSGSATLVLTNPDGRLRFPNAADTTKTVTVPLGGAWVPFEISGETASAVLNDAVIDACCNTVTGDVKGSQTVTVFWFDQAKIDITVGGHYVLSRNLYTVVGANAVDYAAQARIRPAGVDCTAPQVTDLRVGIMQNLFSPSVRTTNWNSPVIRWDPGAASGVNVTVATIIRLMINITVTVNDSEASVAPLYDQPAKTGTISRGSLQSPIGCAGGAVATSSDTPKHPAPAILTLPAKDAGGTIVGQVEYGFVNITMSDNFRTWAVIFNTSDNHLCTLRERVWKTNINSAAVGIQRPTVEADTAPTVAPVTTPPFINTFARSPANQTLGPGSAATTTFTKP